jgi:hypothetical protein
MKTETLKLGLINRLMKVNELSTLERMEELISQAEMESRTKKSLEAIENNDVVSIDKFSKENKKWLSNKYSQ